MMHRSLLLLLTPLLSFALHSRAGMKVSSDFEGGSVEVLEMDSANQILKVAPANHPGKGWRCWWYFRVDGLQPEMPLTLDVGEAPWATPDRAHYSRDGGKNWNQSEPGKRQGKRIRYEIQSTESTSLLLAWGPPFTPQDSQNFVDLLAENESSTAFNLATTRENRPTPALKITAPGESRNRSVIWLQARQHAWESGASWVAKGLGEFLVSMDPAAQRLRTENVIYLVPIMDIDNTVRGAGGKNQKPQDHNRDWSEAPHWKAVAAAQKHIAEANRAGKFAIFIDLHNPGPNDRMPYFYTPPKAHLQEFGRKNLTLFLEAAKKEITGPLRFMGRAIESGPKYDPENWTRISKNWVAENTADGVVSVTLETSWNTPSSTIDHYETVGEQLGRTLATLDLERAEPEK